MGETINITNFSQDFIRKKLTITASTLPTDFDLRIKSKITPKFNLQVRCGFELGFLEKGNINITQNDSTTILNDNEIEGLSDINTGTIVMNNEDFVDLRLWNTDGGTYTVIILIFINSTSEGTFVDALALLEATTKIDTLIDESHIFNDASTFTSAFSMNGYKGIILTMGTGTGLPTSSSVIENLGSWSPIEDLLKRSGSGASTSTLSSSEEIIIDCGEELTDEIVVYANKVGSGTGHIEVETSTDNISYTNQFTGSALPSTSRTLYSKGSDSTFRYIKVIAAVDSGNLIFNINSVGLKGFDGYEADLKFQSSPDNGTTWIDFITSSEYDTNLGATDKDPELYTISRENPSTTNAVYIFPQGNNKLRIHITLSLFSVTNDPNNVGGYGGPVKIEKVN